MNDQVSQRSRELFNSGFYCAESVLMAIAESRGIQSDLIPRIATGFCSGIGRTGGLCGAVSGGVMAIGLTAGRSSPAGQVEDSYTLIQQFISHFEARHGSTNCRELTGCDLASVEGQHTFEENHVIERCQDFVGNAASLVTALIDE
jgi:C_GCAxxG_C_C family probable redox protein